MVKREMLAEAGKQMHSREIQEFSRQHTPRCSFARFILGPGCLSVCGLVANRKNGNVNRNQETGIAELGLNDEAGV